MPGKFGRYRPEKLSKEDYNSYIEGLEEEAQYRGPGKPIRDRDSHAPTGNPDNFKSDEDLFKTKLREMSDQYIDGKISAKEYASRSSELKRLFYIRYHKDLEE